ncbi:hypothetical protein L209DRAFT_615394 [Thermothelomyces heterothallicus CBS 203.75]
MNLKLFRPLGGGYSKRILPNKWTVPVAKCEWACLCFRSKLRTATIDRLARLLSRLVNGAGLLIASGLSETAMQSVGPKASWESKRTRLALRGHVDDKGLENLSALSALANAPRIAAELREYRPLVNRGLGAGCAEPQTRPGVARLRRRRK